MQIAQTPVALFNQMRVEGRTPDEIELVRRAYDLGVELYTGRFEADGSPFQVHGLGTASILSQLGLSAACIAAGCIHNAYGTGDFGDGRGRGAHPHRRALVRERVSAETEAFLASLYGNRLERRSLGASLAQVAAMSEQERLLLTHDLADLLEKWFDGGILYTQPDRRDRLFVAGREDELVELATRLGHTALADALADAFALVRNGAGAAGPGWDLTYSRVILSRSQTHRLAVRVRTHGWSWYARLRRLVSRLRARGGNRA